MSLEKIQRVYEQLGRDDPLWAILTDDRFRGNKWDPEEFFKTGQDEIRGVLADLQQSGVPVHPGSALDFGCGVGRLTQALAGHFEQAIGVDISETMIAGANKWNQFPERCRYLVNTTEKIPAVADQSLDFIYSNIALQHSPPRYQSSYVGEFMRMLKPGGIAVFQMRIGAYREPGSLAEAWYRFSSESARPFWKKIRGRPPVQVHTISEREVEAAISSGGGTLLSAVNSDKKPRSSRRSLRFTVKKR